MPCIINTVLVVDDSVVMRSALRSALTSQNFEVVSARDAGEAIACLEANDNLDLIVTDFHMPGLDGAALIERVRAHRRYQNVPILVLTAGADGVEKLRAKEAGATGWIVKPFDTAKLTAAIHLLVSGKSAAVAEASSLPVNGPSASGCDGASKESMLKVRFNRSIGLIETIVSGPTNREGVERYLASLQLLITEARADWGRYRHLVDARALQLQSSEALSSLSGGAAHNMMPSDRTAVVMNSERAIAQMGHMPLQTSSRVFRDMDAARNWLLESVS